MRGRSPSRRGGQTGEMIRPEHSAKLTTPARQLLLSCRATPPLRGGEWILILRKLPPRTASPPNFIFTYESGRRNIVLQTTIRGILNDQTSESHFIRFGSQSYAGVGVWLCARPRTTAALVHAYTHTLGQASGLERCLGNDGRNRFLCGHPNRKGRRHRCRRAGTSSIQRRVGSALSKESRET